MGQALTAAISVATSIVVTVLAAGCVLYLAVRFSRWLATIALWRQGRTAITALAFVAIVTTILAQKGDRGVAPGTVVPPPVRDEQTTVSQIENEFTNMLHFADIALDTNGTAMLVIAWPPSLLSAGAALDLFAATSLVDSAWGWQCDHQVAADETNWLVTVALPQSSPGTNAPSAFFHVSNRETSADTMDDADGDGLPNAYEIVNGTNPYVPDYGLASKITVGPSGNFADIRSALAASTDYSIIELDPSTQHEITDSFGVQLPQHPVMVTASNAYAVIKATGMAAFMLATNTTARTLFKNLYLLLDAKCSFQTGFWCGGNLPWDGVPASATFENIYMRMPNPDIQYRGWIFYRRCTGQSVIRNCTLNAAGATWAVGIDAYGSPPLAIDRCSFVNFPPETASNASCGALLRTSATSDEGSDVTISCSLFDESFTNAWPFARFDSTNSCFVTVSGCIVPRYLPSEYLPDCSTNIVVTNVALAWSGMPYPDSPSVGLGIGSLVPIANDPVADRDGDGFSDYNETYERGTDPYMSDSDNDGIDDWTEICTDGTDPTNPHSFKQRLAVSVTNTVSLAYTTYTAWGYSPEGWETNGLETFSQGFGDTVYTNASSHGATCIKAFCDLNGNGEYEAATDILISWPIPAGANAQVDFVFGDVDGDGVSDAQERQDGTDPYDGRHFRFTVNVDFKPCDTCPWLTNFVAWGYAQTGWETNGMASFIGTNLLFTIDEVVTNRELYAKVFRDLNTNGVYDVNIDEYHWQRLTSADNGKTVTLNFGDADNNMLPDWWEMQEGLYAEGVARRAYDDPDGDGLINLHEFWSGTHPLVPDGSNTLLSVASRSIDDRIRDIDPATSIPRFINYFINGTNGIFQLNTNFWARDLDLSCVSVWNTSANPGGRTATLITRKHVVMAAHWPADVYKFCDTNGVILTRTVVKKETISDDLRLGRLNEPLPDSFTPARVPSTNIVRYLASGKYLPTLCVNQEKGATVLELAEFDAEATRAGGGHFYHYGHTSHTNLVSTKRCNVRRATVDGNSGCPVFVVAGNKLVLLFAIHLMNRGIETWTNFWGPMLPFRLEAVQQKIYEWEGDDANLYQVEPFDFSPFGEIVNNQ